ncbi:MAG: T9SS type A sorting domain-containing protein [Bacteroidales bacterium]
MRKYILILFSLAIQYYLHGQSPVGSWSDHLSGYTARSIALSSGQVFANAGSSITVFDKQYEELRKISRVQGLSETSISNIGWSADKNCLIIAYASTNVDIMQSNTIYNIPDIKRKYIAGKKEIYRIITRGKYAYLATSFGIVIIDLDKKEIFDTWKPGTPDETAEVFDIAFSETDVIAATSLGLYAASAANQGLSYYGNWHIFDCNPAPTGRFNAVIFKGGSVFLNRAETNGAGDSLFIIESGTRALLSWQLGIFNNYIDSSPEGFTVTSRGMIRFFNNSGILTRAITSYNPGTVDFVHSVSDGTDIWIADKSSGLIRGKNMTEFIRLNLPGPYSDNVISVTSRNGKTYFTAGAVDNAWNNQWRPFQVASQENNSWHTELSYTVWDAMRVLPDALDNDHYWVTTWGSGLLEYENNTLKNKYDDSNSPLETIIPDKPYSRICGIAMDKSRNLWITQTGVNGSIKVLKPDGTWIVNPVTIEAPTIGDIIVASNGYKWVVLPRGYGIFVLDDNKTPDIFTDDRYKQMLIKDTDDKIISNVYSLAEDLDGNIWVGTDQGPAIYYNPGRIFDSDPRAFRVKVPRDDGTGLADYMLGTEIITSIAIDGGNRKWLGTFSSGAYLLSADGTQKISNFNEENSPLLSNTVVGVSVDGNSGEVWFATALGIISFRGNATDGDAGFRNVYTFPNPVRESYNGNVTITGLMRNTSVKITDISGNLVYSTVSDGGQATWDLRTYNGERVSTGVYLVFCASEDGTSSIVTKMLVIK